MEGQGTSKSAQRAEACQRQGVWRRRRRRNPRSQPKYSRFQTPGARRLAQLQLVIETGCFGLDVSGLFRSGLQIQPCCPRCDWNEKSFPDQLKHGVTLEFFPCTLFELTLVQCL